MIDKKLTADNRPIHVKKVDTKEFELPETLFISDIDTKVIQGIVLQSLSNIADIALVAGNFIDNIFGRGGPEIGTGINAEQDAANHSVSIKIEVNIRYGTSIPDKAEEIQTKTVQEITRLTGLRVASIHVVFKNIIAQDQTSKMLEQLSKQAAMMNSKVEEYNDQF